MRAGLRIAALAVAGLACAAWGRAHDKQTTVFLIQNASQAAVTGSIFFYSATGTLLHTEPLSVPRSGLQVVLTAGITQLAGLSGHATIAHTGGWGALAAKAVAVEPATGFTFDTLAVPLPR
jgi:hypothetical protein